MREEWHDVWVMFLYFGGITFVWAMVRGWRANRGRVWPMRHDERERHVETPLSWGVWPS